MALAFSAVYLRFSLDDKQAAQLEVQAADLYDKGPCDLLLDLSRCTFISEAALSVLLGIHARLLNAGNVAVLLFSVGAIYSFIQEHKLGDAFLIADNYLSAVALIEKYQGLPDTDLFLSEYLPALLSFIQDPSSKGSELTLPDIYSGKIPRASLQNFLELNHFRFNGFFGRASLFIQNHSANTIDGKPAAEFKALLQKELELLKDTYAIDF